LRNWKGASLFPISQNSFFYYIYREISYTAVYKYYLNLAHVSKIYEPNLYICRAQFLRLTVASLRGFGEHRRAKIGPQRSERMRAEQGQKRAPGPQVALFENWLVRRSAKSISNITARRRPEARRGHKSQYFLFLPWNMETHYSIDYLFFMRIYYVHIGGNYGQSF